MKIRALPSFEGIRDNERNVYPKAGEVWEVNEERANFLKKHGVVEFVEEQEEQTEVQEEVTEELVEEEKEEPQTKSNKKSSKK